MKVLFYGNGSSGNHGCEAIVRGTQALLGHHDYTIYSANVEEDRRYGLDAAAELDAATQQSKKNLDFLKAYLRLKLKKDSLEMDGLQYVPGIDRARGKTDVALSVGGDNYCYAGTQIYGWLNKAYHKAGIKTVLWGCSVEPELVLQKSMAEDLSRYDLVVARESITYEAIRQVQERVILFPDPAFFMAPASCKLSHAMECGNVIGINVSPHILKCETNKGQAYENYKTLISYILDETDNAVALIPHVVWDSNDDRKVLRQLYDDFDQNERIILVEDHSAPELKYIISRCKMFVGARTHATIAAYSSCVPTLVVGYSVKARGIAKDLFGTDEHYVLPVQSLQHADDLTNAFCWLLERETEVRQHLVDFMPGYIESGYRVKEILENL